MTLVFSIIRRANLSFRHLLADRLTRLAERFSNKAALTRLKWLSLLLPVAFTIGCTSSNVTTNTASTNKSLLLIEQSPTEIVTIEAHQNPLLKEFLVAEFKLHRGDLRGAYDAYYALALEQANLTAISRAADIALAMKDLTLIEQSSRFWLTLETDKQRPYQLNYAIQVRNAQDAAARDILDQALTNQVDIQFIHDEINKSARKAEQITTIQNGLNQLLESWPNDVELNTALARIDFLQGDFQAALEKTLSLKEQVGKAHLSIESYLIIAFSQNQLDQLPQAIASLEDALEQYPNTLRLLSPLLDFLLQNEQIAEANERYLNSDLPVEEAAQLAISYIGQIIEDGNPEKALALLKPLDYHLSGFLNQFYYLEANALALLDRKEEAVKLLLQIDGALTLSATEQAAIWLYDINNAKDINPMIMSRLSDDQNLDIILSISFLHEDHGQLELADQLLTLALEKYQNAHSLRYKKALLADQRGLWSETEKELRYLVSLEPENPQYLNALGYTLLQYTEQLEEAMQLIQKAYQINAEDPAIIDSLGWGYFLQGNHEQALFYLKKAWKLLKDPEIGAHLGEVLWQTNPEKANRIWLQALENEINHKTLKETIKRLNPTFIFPDTTPTSYTDIAQEQSP